MRNPKSKYYQIQNKSLSADRQAKSQIQKSVWDLEIGIYFEFWIL